MKDALPPRRLTGPRTTPDAIARAGRAADQPPPDDNPHHPYSADPEVRALADELIERAGRTFPFPGELDLLIAEDIATAVINSDWLRARGVDHETG